MKRMPTPHLPCWFLICQAMPFLPCEDAPGMCANATATDH